MYYRVAIQVDPVAYLAVEINSAQVADTLILWLQYYRVLPHDRLRIFSSSSREELNEQALGENQGLATSSVPVTQFLQERKIALQRVGCEASTSEAQANKHMASVATVTKLSPCESNRSPLNKRREELERGVGA